MDKPKRLRRLRLVHSTSEEMSSSAPKPDRSPLRIVHQTSERYRKTIAGLERLNDCEFNCGGLEEALEHKEQLMHCISAPKGLDPQGLVEQAKAAILKTLCDDNDILLISKTRDRIFSRWAERLEKSEEPVYAIEQISQDLRFKAERILTLEGLQDAILRDFGIQIHNGDTTRLLIHEMNQGRMTPSVIGLINGYKPYNPFYVAPIVGRSGVSAATNRLLRFFNY